MPFSSAVHTSCPVTKGRSGDSKVGLEAGDRGRGGESRSGASHSSWGSRSYGTQGEEPMLIKDARFGLLKNDRCALCYMHLQQ